MDEEDEVVEDCVPGPYVVVKACIDCDTCRCIAPTHFDRSPERGFSYVCKQPSTDEETELVEEAIDCCPVEAIRKVSRDAPIQQV